MVSLTDDESEIAKYDVKLVNGYLLWNLQGMKLKLEYYHGKSVKQ